jgi:hypothetical protein
MDFGFSANLAIVLDKALMIEPGTPRQSASSPTDRVCRAETDECREGWSMTSDEKGVAFDEVGSDKIR